MNRNSKYKKIVAVTTAASLVVTTLIGCQSNTNSTNTNVQTSKTPISSETTGTVSTATRNGVAEKEETVYVKADATGSTSSIIVSNWLKNGNGSTVINDISNLQDIVNVKGEETFTADGSNINWAANGADIYYQGTSKEKLPVQLKITYSLDGKEISPEKLAGKSGHVKIHMEYVNNTTQTITVDGKQVETIVPFAVLGGTLFDTTKFTNITVTNGKVISDGNNAIVAGVAFPGLQSRLTTDKSDLIKEVKIPEYIEMEADVNDFSLPMTMSVVLNNLFKDIDLDNMDSFDDLKDKLETMTEGYDKIADGGEELSGYMGELVKGVNTLASGVDKLDKGSPKLESGITSISQGIGTAKEGSGKLVTGSKQLYDGAKKLSGYTEQLSKGVTDVKSAIDKLVAAYEGNSNTKGLKEGAADLSTGASQIDAGVTKLNTSLDSMYQELKNKIATNKQTITALQNKIARLQTLAGKYQAGTITAEEAKEMEALNGQLDTMKTNMAALTGANQALQAIIDEMDKANMMDSVDQLNSGTTALATGAKSVSKGVSDMYKANVKLQKGLKTLKKGADGIDSGANDLYTSLGTAYKGVKKLDTGLSTLNTGTSTFKKALLTYSQGVGSVNEGVTTLKTNAVKLQEGAEDLSKGINEFKEKALNKIKDVINDNFDVIKEQLTAMIKADQAYTTYSGASEDMNSSVKFIIETEEISAK